MRVGRVLETTLLMTLSSLAETAEAQLTAPKANVVLSGGYAGFLDESVINHTAFGAGAEWILRSRIAVGPEIHYLVGPGSDRGLFLIGVARFGILPFERRIVPFATAGGGLMTHSDRFNSQTFRSSEGALVFGAGMRVVVSQTVYVAPRS